MWSISCVHLEEVYFGKEMLSPFFLLQNSVADWGNSAERMPWALDANVLSAIPGPKKMHLIKEYQHLWH